ncbi:ADP-ribosylation factor GTPase-activating protein [Actinidia chinensis var. chinensis]|uniref:ADP-ribosylation factor GTPase-activating protein n=1 Tax=Actinidia chinensis var. chinensis TaxID=1590841 RepID=A0A2R6Q2T0_ACTCC|nr:ADP-ribosylation factor GTPase-activating protein [Actinidia chinensis var. chinensis]
MSKSSRAKEEERIEKIIRNLLKLQENRRCINCNSLGPQYVCTTFWTFVCTNCSGVHREFTHRVKSVSMAKFNAEEVNALQAGGNERARQIYFKEWDPQRHSFPDGSNQNGLRDFIKHVYVDRKFTGERSVDKLAMVKADAKGDFCERRSFERPSPGGRIDGRSLKYYIEERSSPRYKPENVRSSGHRNRPVHFEVVDDRFRDDRFGSGRTHRLSNAESRAGSGSPIPQRSREKSSPPVVRPVSDILGENVPRLQVVESPKAGDRRDNESSDHDQKRASSSDPGSVATNNAISLIDFSDDPEPPDLAAAPQTLQTATSIEAGSGASDPPKVNSLESILFELSAPASGPVDIMSEAPDNSDTQSGALLAFPSNVAAPVTASTTNGPAAPSSVDAPVASPVGQHLPITHQNQLYASVSGDNIYTPSAGDLYDQSWTPSIASNAQGSSTAAAEETSQPGPKAAQDTTSGTGSQALLEEAKSCGRKELPADLFTLSYSSFPAPVSSWQIRPPHGMGYNMQYHPAAMAVAAYPSSAKSRNPFDLNDDGPEPQVPMFPSMLAVQGALQNLAVPPALSHTSNIRPSQLMQPHATSYASIAPPHLASYGAFTEQQLPSNMPFSRPQNTNTISRGEDVFALLNPIHPPSSRYPAPTTPNSSLAGGNPFG